MGSQRIAERGSRQARPSKLAEEGQMQKCTRRRPRDSRKDETCEPRAKDDTTCQQRARTLSDDINSPNLYNKSTNLARATSDGGRTESVEEDVEVSRRRPWPVRPSRDRWWGWIDRRRKGGVTRAGYGAAAIESRLAPARARTGSEEASK